MHLKKKTQIASNVPKCNATSKDSEICSQLNIHGNKFKCAELDTGKNSVNPSTIAMIIVSNMLILLYFSICEEYHKS